MPRAVCVYCASSNHVDPVYFDAARTLGTLIGKAGDTLVYGGGKVGLMGELARAVHAAGGKVVGVIPESMTDVEIAYHDADELIVTHNMRQRKAIMDERADGFLALPGGFGTLEELSEVITHRLLKFHDKPIVIVNTAGFYDPLIALFEHFISKQFARDKHRSVYAVCDDVAAAYRLVAQD